MKGKNYVKQLIDGALEEGIGFDQMPITEEDYDCLDRIYALRDAKEAIWKARRGESNYQEVKTLVDAALAFGISYDELETSAEEILGLPRVYLVKDASSKRFYVMWGYCPLDEFESSITAAREAGVSLEEIGTSEPELEVIRYSARYIKAQVDAGIKKNLL